MTKMRIAMVGTKGIPAKWGGIEKYIEEVGHRLVERGHEVTVFGSKWYCKGYDKKTYLGMRIIRLPTIHLQATDALTNAFFAMISILGGSYDIVHFHGFASYFFVPIIKKAGKLSVITIHAMESNWGNDKYSSFGQKVLKCAFKIGIRHADRVTTVAEHLRANIKKNYNRQAMLLPSGIDNVTPLPPQVIKAKYGLNGSNYLLFLGRIDPIKRVDWLLDLSGILNNNVRVVIAGGAQDPPTEAYLQSLKQKAGNDSKIIFTGPVFGDEKSELLSNCLLFLAPSQNEGLPITLLEAIAYGRCCIASDIPAHSVVIQNEVTGFLFPSDDKDGFIAKVVKLINESEKLKSIGKAARQHAELIFDWERTADETKRVYDELLREPRRIAQKKSGNHSDV
jgi:glycosyltransferase involved in cell wall biosynthesis